MTREDGKIAKIAAEAMPRPNENAAQANPGGVF
jgi:hypothetical protein